MTAAVPFLSLREDIDEICPALDAAYDRVLAVVMFNFLGDRELGTQVHYPIPPHLQEAYGDLPVDR